jgi:hypothetical protein
MAGVKRKPPTGLQIRYCMHRLQEMVMERRNWFVDRSSMRPLKAAEKFELSIFEDMLSELIHFEDTYTEVLGDYPGRKREGLDS